MAGRNAGRRSSVLITKDYETTTMIRPAPNIDAVPASTPFVGPEQLMRESGRSELVRLGANESAFGPSPKAVEAMASQLGRLSSYGDPDSYDLRAALAAKHGCRIEEILVGAGIDDVMGVAVRAFLEPGATALTTRGSYPTFVYHVLGYAGRLATVPYRDDGLVDLGALTEAAHRERAKIVYLANPDNPSGTFAGRASVERFAAALPADALLFLDEAYADFVDEAELLDGGISERIVRTRTFSKAYGMAGARIGYAIASQNHLETFGKIRLQYGVNRNAQIGALASLSDEAFRTNVVRETERAREDYYAIAAELGMGYIRSRANFVCIDAGSERRAVRIVEKLLERGVWIRKPGSPPLDRYIRVSAGTPAMRRAFADSLRAIVAAEAAA